MKPLALNTGANPTTVKTPSSTPVLPPTITSPATSTSPTTKAPPANEALPLPPTPVVMTKQAGQGDVPSWATPGWFEQLANAGDGSSPLKGGRGLQVRMQAMTTSSSPTAPPKPSEATRQRGLGLLQRALHGVGVIGGRPLAAAEIAEAPPALHLTKPEAVASILEHGLRPTTGLYKNLTTWFRQAVYMFGNEPSAAQRFVNFSTAASQATAVIELDLKKLDPDKLYKRVLDGAIIYVSNEPIPKEALRLRSGS